MLDLIVKKKRVSDPFHQRDDDEGARKKLQRRDEFWLGDPSVLRVTLVFVAASDRLTALLILRMLGCCVVANRGVSLTGLAIELASTAAFGFRSPFA